MAYHRFGSRDPKVKLVRAHSYLTDNAIIDDFGPKIGAHGVAVYHALNRFADRQTGECWPKIKKIGAKLRLSAGRKGVWRRWVHGEPTSTHRSTGGGFSRNPLRTRLTEQ